MNQILNLFPVPVLKGHIDPPEGLMEQIQEVMGKNRGAWASESGVSTGELGVHLHEEVPLMKDLLDGLIEHVIYYWDQGLKYAPANLHPLYSWCNFHEKGDFTGEHSHCSGILGSHIATVYYLEKGEGGDIRLCDPLDYIRRLTPIRSGGADEPELISESVPARTGDFLLFPGWIRHRTEFATGKRKAISINWNGEIIL